MYPCIIANCYRKSSIQLQQSLRYHSICKILEVCINSYTDLFGSDAGILYFLSLHQMTPLHLAAKRGHLKIIKCLVGAKGTVVKINVQDKKGVNAFCSIADLELASFSGGKWQFLFYLLLVCQLLKLLVVPTKSLFQSQLDPMRMNMHPVSEIYLLVCYILNKPEISESHWLTMHN